MRASIFEIFNFAKSKSVIKEIDVRHENCFGFTEEELDYNINYDIKYRIGIDRTEEE